MSLATSSLQFTWDLHTVDHCVTQLDDVADYSLHLIGGNILAFPAKCVSSSVSEIEISKLIHY